MKPLDRLSLEQINRRVEVIRSSAKHMHVNQGWIHFLRKSLGMTLSNLADRTNLSIPSIQQAERNEKSGAITLNQLKKMAEAMDCELVYSFVPKAPIQSILQNAAFEKAQRLLKETDVQMKLEGQSVKHKMRDRVELLAQTLLKKGDIW